MPSLPARRFRRRGVIVGSFLALAFVLSSAVAYGPTSAASADHCDPIRMGEDPDCYHEIPPPPPPTPGVPCTLFPNNPYGPYCGILGDYFDPNSPCSPYYCGGPFVMPIDESGLVDETVIAPSLVEAIRIRENRPGVLVESELDTVAGIPASMATVEQATIGYVLDAVRDHSNLRSYGDPTNPALQLPIYQTDIDRGYAKIQATRDLLDAVAAAARAGELNVEEFIGHNINLFLAVGLPVEDVRTMYRAVPLRDRVLAAAARVDSGASTADQEVAQIAVDDRLGVSAADLRRYIQEPTFWLEHRRAWERKAMRTLPNNFGYRLEAIAVAGQGRAMADQVYRARVHRAMAELRCTGEGRFCYDVTEDLVVLLAAATNNAGTNYGPEVLTIYCRIVYNRTC